MSTNRLLWITLVAAAFSMLAASAQGQVPQLINYQGQLTDASGIPVTNSSLSMNFRVYDAETGGTLLWQETQTVAVTGGVFDVLLGSSDAIPLNLFDGGISRWLEVRVSGTALTPRRRFGSVPYAFASRGGSGDISAVNAGTGLSGGGTSGDVTLTLDTGFADGRYINTGEANSVSSSMIQNGAVVKSLNGLNDQVTLAAGSNVSITPSGNTLTISATNFSNPGDITAIRAGAGLTGGAESGEATLAVTNNGITSDMIQDNAVGNNDLANGAVTSAKIQDGTIQQSDLGFSAGDITAVNVGTGLTGGSTSGEVTVALNTSFTDGQYVNEGQTNSITSSMIQDGTIQQFDLGFPAGDITAVNAGAGLTGGGSSGSVTLSVDNNAITSAMIQDNTILNVDVNSSAAIAGTKIDPNFGAQNIITGGRLGIGTINPAAKLTVEAAAHINAIFDRTDTKDFMTLTVGSAGSGIHFGDGNRFFISAEPYSEKNTTSIGKEVFSILSSGNAGIGTVNPQEKLHVAGNFIRVEGAGNEQAYIGGDGQSNDVQIGSSNASVSQVAFYNSTTNTFMDLLYRRLIPSSSRRWKTNIKSVEGALDKVRRLRGVSFDWKADGKHDLGLIAEEVGEVIPEIVAYEENGKDAKGLDYSRLVALLIEAVKEQQKEITELKAAVKSLAAAKQSRLESVGE